MNAQNPSPNEADGAGNYADSPNYTYQLKEPEWYKALTERVDWTRTAKDRFFFRSSIGHFHYIRPICCQVDNIAETAAGRQYFVAILGWDRVFTNNLSMSTAVSYTRLKYPYSYPVEEGTSAADWGLPAYLDTQTAASQMSPLLPPSIGYNIYQGLDYSYSTNATYYKTPSIRSNVTWVHGAHVMQFGGEYRLQQFVSLSNAAANSALQFDNTYTQISDDTGYLPTGASDLGTDYAAMLLGYQTNAYQSVGNPDHLGSPYFSLFAQEDWRFNRKLTLNAGIRFEHESPPVESGNRQIVGYDPNQQLVIGPASQSAYAANLSSYNAALPSGFSMPATINVNGGALYAGVNGAPRGIFNASSRVLPRLAAAYELNPKTVFRVGYGLFYGTLNAENTVNDQNGYSIATSINSSYDYGQTYIAQAAIPILDPFPLMNGIRFLAPYGNTLGNLVYTGQGQNYWPRNFAPPRMERWQASVERQLDRFSMIQLGYEGSYMDHLSVVQNMNATPAGYYTTGQVQNPNYGALTQTVNNPFYITNYSSLASSNPVAYGYLAQQNYFNSTGINLNTLLSPNPIQGSLTENNDNGKSRLNEILVTYKRRFGSNIDVLATFTRIFQFDKDWFVHDYDTTPTWHNDVSSSRPWRLAGTAVWKLPFGQGMAYANRGWEKMAFGGFQYGLTFEAQPGPLLTWGNVFFSGCTTSWKTCDTSSIKLSHPSYGEWFNTVGFNRSALPNGLNDTVFPYVIKGVRQMGINNWNMNVQKDVPIVDGVKLSLRLEAMDVFNHLLVAGPNVNPASANFGRVTADAYGGQPNYGRFIQISGRVTF